MITHCTSFYTSCQVMYSTCNFGHFTSTFTSQLIDAEQIALGISTVFTFGVHVPWLIWYHVMPYWFTCTISVCVAWGRIPRHDISDWHFDINAEQSCDFLSCVFDGLMVLGCNVGQARVDAAVTSTCTVHNACCCWLLLLQNLQK